MDGHTCMDRQQVANSTNDCICKQQVSQRIYCCTSKYDQEVYFSSYYLTVDWNESEPLKGLLHVPIKGY